MKKTVIKTALITLFSVLFSFVIVYISISFISPKTLGRAYKDLGNYGLTVKYFEKQYNKTKSCEDLYELIVVLDENKDYLLAKKYSSAMTERTDYINFCSVKDAEIINGISTNEFVYSKYVIASSYESVDDSIEIAYGFCIDYGYTTYNPFRVLFSNVDLSDSEKQTVVEKLNQIKAQLSSEVQINLITSDINSLQ